MAINIIDLYKNLFGKRGIADGNVIDMAEHGRVGGISTGQPFKFTTIVDKDNGETAGITSGKLDVNASIDTTGLATDTGQASLLTELQAKADLTETQPVSLASVPSHAVTNAGTFAVTETTPITGFATATTQDAQTTLLQGIGGFTLTGYDYIALTYVAAGNGVGEIETATFKTGGAGGTTIATLTLTYNDSNEVATVTKT